MRGCSQLRTCFADLQSARLADLSITKLLWSGFGITDEHPRTLENGHRVCLLIDSHRHRSFTLVSYTLGSGWTGLMAR